MPCGCSPSHFDAKLSEGYRGVGVLAYGQVRFNSATTDQEIPKKLMKLFKRLNADTPRSRYVYPG